MSQMSLEEEKVPGDFARMAARDGGEVAQEQQAPADDGFIRAAAAPRSLAQTMQDRKFESSLYRNPEPEAVAPAVGKAGSRSTFMDNASGVLDWAGKGLGLVKEADDTATLYGKDIPDVMDAAGEQFGGLREGMDSALEGYAPVQEAFQGIGKWTDAANKTLNPLPKVTLGKVGGKDIKLGVGTKEILSAASGAMQIAQFHKNEGADPLATASPQRAAVAAGQTEFRRALEARRRAARLFEKAGGYEDAGGVGMSPAHTEDGSVQKLLLEEKKRANLKALQKGMRLALRANDLGKAQEKKGVRSLNEYSMEKTAYLNDKEFVPRKPLGVGDDPQAAAWSPKKGMIKDGEIAKATDYIEASKTVHDRYAKQGAVKGQELPPGLMAGMQDSAKLEALDDGYRDDIEGGRSKQKQVALARFLGGAGQLVEGKLDSKRLVRDGRYKTAYAAKAAELGVITGTKAGAGAAQAGLIAGTGGVAAPLIAAAEAGKHLAFHAKEQLGMGMQSASEGLEGLIDPQGLAKEQDNRDLYNKHFGLQKQVQAPDDSERGSIAPGNNAPENDVAGDNVAPSEASDEKQPAPLHPFFTEAPKPEPLQAGYDEVQQIMDKKHEYFGMNPEEFQAVQAQRGAPAETPAVQPEVQPEQVPAPQQEAAAPTYDEMTADPSARAADIRERGIIWEKQGSAAVLGRQKRTWGRAAKDVLWGGTKKVAKGLWGGIKGLFTLPIHAAKWGWQGAKMAGRGLAAAGRGIASLFSRKKAAEPGNKAREALKAMEQHTEKYKDTAVIDRPQLKVDRLKDLDDLGDLSDEEKVKFRQLREQHAEVYGERDEFGDEPGRVGGTRQAAKDALMAKPEVKRAEERAALREQLAPGKYTPRMESGELLDLLRGRARAELDAEEQQPGPGGGGPGGGGPGGGGPQGDLLDQINQLEGGGDVRPDRAAGSVPTAPSSPAGEQDFGPGGRPPFTAEERDRQRDSYEGSQAEIAELQKDISRMDRRAARRQKKAQAAGMIQPGGARGDQKPPQQQVEPSKPKGVSRPKEQELPSDQEEAFAAAFGSSARDNYREYNEGAAPDAHLKAAAEGYFSVNQPKRFDPYAREEELLRERREKEQRLAGLPSGREADMADAEALRGHRARMEDYQARLDAFEKADPGAFAKGGEARMEAWDQANPRPQRPETIHDQRTNLQSSLAQLANPRDIVDQSWSSHREDVGTYRRRQEYLERFAPDSKQRNRDLARFNQGHAQDAILADAFRQGQPRPLPQEEEKAVRPEGGPPQPKAPAHVEAPLEQPVGRPLSGGPLLGPDQAQGIGTLDRGGGAVDIDLGRALNSTPRLERNARGYWGNTDYDPATDSPEYARDDLFIEEAKDRAIDAIRAGQKAGADAEAYRAKFGDIKKKHAGGFLNPKNWDRTRARREDKLRSQIQRDYPATAATTAQQAQPESAPSTAVTGAVDQGSAIPISRHRTAMPVKSALRSREGQKAARVPMADVAEAEKRVASAFDREDQASQPFSSGGAHAGKLDATMRGGALRTSGLDAAKGPLMTGQLLFGVSNSSPKVSDQARDQVMEYRDAIAATHAAEVDARTLTARQVQRDQGNAAMDMPDFTGPMRPYRTPFFNGYWQREQANPQPTAQSTSGKSVSFDSSAEQVPNDQRDPARPFAIKQAQHDHAKQERRAKIEAGIESYKKNMAPSWAAAGEAGAATHKHERRVPFKAAPPVDVLQQKLIEEE